MYLSRLPRAFPAVNRRSFVSTNLLSRTWENETVVELRREAKTRSLSTGNKSTLIARIKEHEQNSITSSPPAHTPGTTRSAATNVVSPKKTFQATSPGIPLPARPDSASTSPNFMVIKLPDLTQPPLNPPVQVPFVPDFWNSARPKADAPLELEPPKLHVVSGSVTHHDGGPMHNLETLQERDSLPTVTVQADDTPANKGVGFWPDFWESLGLPRSFSISRSLSKAADLTSQTGEDESQHRSRPLTDEERKGLYILLGTIGGSWLVGGLIDRPTVVTEENDTRNQH